MSTAVPSYPTAAFAGFRSRSIGTKFFVIFFLALFMSIPAFFVDDLVDSRAQARGATTHFENGVAIAPQTVLGIKMADSYRSLTRSLKYVTLFLGLVFVTYFVFEVTANKRIHPGQYALIGVAQIIFYLLLLSLAELCGFDLAFLIAGAATVALISANAEWIFASRKLGLRAFGVFSLLYAFIYVLLRLQNYALLVGACASFVAVGLTMYLTRKIDWYSAAGERAATAAGAGSLRESWLE